MSHGAGSAWCSARGIMRFRCEPGRQCRFRLASSPISIDLDGMQLRWFDHWLKGAATASTREAPVRVFTMGINQWRDEKDWPLPAPIFAASISTAAGARTASSAMARLRPSTPARNRRIVYLYNPLDPAPTIGGGLCCYPGALQGGAWDQREARVAPTCWSIRPSRSPKISKSPARSADAVRVVLGAGHRLHCEAGRRRIVRLRAQSHRRNHSCALPRIIRDAKMLDARRGLRVHHRYVVNLEPVSEGHRIRLEISSSNFPRFDRNPNTGHELSPTPRRGPRFRP